MDEQENKQRFDVEVYKYDSYNQADGSFTEVKEVYEDVIGYQMGTNVLAVMTKEGETILIPINEFKQVRHYPVNV